MANLFAHEMDHSYLSFLYDTMTPVVTIIIIMFTCIYTVFVIPIQIVKTIFKCTLNIILA